MVKGLYEKIMTATKLVVDPPSGWMCGFPRVWDKAVHPELEDFLRAKGYPEKDISFACSYCRMWLPEEEKNDGADA